MRELMTSAKIAAPKFRYTPCVRSGGMGFVSGMVALDPETGDLIEGNAGEQTMRILRNLELALPDYGFTLDELCMARIYTTEMDNFKYINTAWETQFSQIEPPARTSIGVVALPLGAKVEIEFYFVRANAKS